MNYIKKKRNTEDLCNICGQFSRLTWDHVPPKSVTGMVALNANTVFSGIPTETAHQKEYQSGLKFRSICAECNNNVLGGNDSVYKNFSQRIAQAIYRAEVMPQRVLIPVQVNRLLKAVLGHMLAAKEFYDADCLVDKELRDYVLGQSEKPDICLYYWIYPYNTVFSIRDVVSRGYDMEDPGIPQSMISVMASFPIAYMLTEKGCKVEGLHDLLEYQAVNDDDVVEIPIDFTTAIRNGALRHFAWPCNIGKEIAFVLAGTAGSQDSRIGVPKTRKG